LIFVGFKLLAFYMKNRSREAIVWAVGGYELAVLSAYDFGGLK
jgi:hypothetical protein